MLNGEYLKLLWSVSLELSGKHNDSFDKVKKIIPKKKNAESPSPSRYLAEASNWYIHVAKNQITDTFHLGRHQ